MKLIKILLKTIFLILFFLSSHGFSDTLNKIVIVGNDRISDETIKLFIQVELNDEINNNKLNDILKDLYETDFFKDISVSFKNQILSISVEENPIIENILYEGIKSNRILDIIKKETSIRSRSSYNERIIKKEKLKIENILKNLGYYNSNIETLVEQKKNNLVNVTYNINLGKKSKIKKITFIGNKVFKDKKLRRIITSTEYKFWKFISGRKFLNQNSSFFDERLLKIFIKIMDIIM
jgi:outer membrane protein insertion porin family